MDAPCGETMMERSPIQPFSKEMSAVVSPCGSGASSPLRCEEQKTMMEIDDHTLSAALSSLSSCSSSPILEVTSSPASAPPQYHAAATSSPSLPSPSMLSPTHSSSSLPLSSPQQRLTDLNQLCELSEIENSQLEMDCALTLTLVRKSTDQNNSNKAVDTKEKRVSVSSASQKNNISSTPSSPIKQQLQEKVVVSSPINHKRKRQSKNYDSDNEKEEEKQEEEYEEEEETVDEEEEDEYSEDDGDQSDDEYDMNPSKEVVVRSTKTKDSKTAKKRNRPLKPLALRQRSTPEKWSKDEDIKLTKLFRKYSEENLSDMWTRISEHIPNKTPSQCFQHWNRVLNPEIRKDPWTVEEESVLLSLTSDGKGKSWSHVAQSLKGRTDIQCRYQYQKLERSKKCAWTHYEDDLLKDLVIKNTNSSITNKNDSQELSTVEVQLDQWVAISTEMYKCLIKNKQTQYKTPPRGALECKTRWEATHCKKELTPIPVTSNKNNNNNNSTVKQEKDINNNSVLDFPIPSRPKRKRGNNNNNNTSSSSLSSSINNNNNNSATKPAKRSRAASAASPPPSSASVAPSSPTRSHSDMCTACQEEDEDLLITCHECEYAYHVKCLNPPLKKVPRGKWYCVTCNPSHPLSDISSDSSAPSSPQQPNTVTKATTTTTPAPSELTQSPSPSRVSTRNRKIPQKYGENSVGEYDYGEKIIVQWQDGLWYKAEVVESAARWTMVKFTDGSIQKVNNDLITSDDDKEEEEDEEEEEQQVEVNDDDEETSEEGEQDMDSNDQLANMRAISRRRRSERRIRQ